MSSETHNKAFLSKHVYGDMEGIPLVAGTEIRMRPEHGDAKFEILKVVTDPLSGYQGAIYKNIDTGELIVAHRGTEPKPLDVRDVQADAQIILDRRNQQTVHAMALIEDAQLM
jgi:hypothetical protein